MKKIQVDQTTRNAAMDFVWLAKVNWASILIMIVVVLEIVDALRPLP